MFSQLFQKRKSERLSKLEYWKEWDLFELFEDLHKAEKLLAEIVNNNNEFNKFKSDFIEELYEIEGDNVADFTKICYWFAPKKEWETFCGQSGQNLGLNIYNITNKWKRNHGT
ncbi:MAG: hypothetical protein DI598_19270 [Pseudopedobacter saltans]|uniref:Uncharacterized protein n=1 Tax=Pseudopedobacter saltans TaxID=151895 RepID=A0A2W5GB04_9SPHI|nr:MAG: hypothetical protein DI598_19270 [Pseudopedobacter saltans]